MSRAGRILFGLAALAVFTLLLWHPWGEGPLPPGPSGPPPPAGRKNAPHPKGPLEGASSPAGKRTPLAPLPAEEEKAARSCLAAGRFLFEGRPVEGALVEWCILVPGRRIRAVAAARARTGKDGWFRFFVPPKTEGILRARKEGLPPFPGKRETALGAGEFLSLGDLSFPEPCSLEVEILDRSEGNPVPGALVRVSPPPGILLPLDPPLEGRTGPKGRARLGPLPRGPWRLLVRARGFSPYQQSLALPREEGEGPLTLYLARGPGLAGRVVDEKGRPLPGALVNFQPLLQGDEDHRAGGSLKADEEGNFRIRGLEEGDWSLEGRAPGRASPKPVKAVCPAGKPVTLILRPLPRVSGRVVAPGRASLRALPGARAALTRKGGFAGAWVLSPLARPVGLDRKGRFRITLDRFPPPETKWIVVAWVPGLPPGQSGEFFFERGKGPENLEIRLPRPGWARGRVLPPKGARVTVESSSDLPFPPFLPFQREISTAPSPDGRFTLGPLSPGPRKIRFSSPDRVSLVRPIQALSGKIQDLGTVSLKPGVVVGGILLGPSGTPEPGGWVWLRPVSGGSPRKTMAGPGGRFRFPPVPPGKYFIQACRRDAGPLRALKDYAASRRLLVLSGRTYWIEPPITLVQRR